MALTWTTFGGDVHVGGVLSLKDGVTAPAATAGKAKLYVDVADGDLKIEFGDDFGAVVQADS
jgi:hypothetical protein